MTATNVRQATNRLLELIEEGALDRDNVIMACVKYMSEDDVADMCHINEFFDSEPDFSQYDSDVYDVEAMEVDYRNGNFDESDTENYMHENIVRTSLINGQFTQAKAQCESYGLNYEAELADFKHSQKN